MRHESLPSFRHLPALRRPAPPLRVNYRAALGSSGGPEFDNSWAKRQPLIIKVPWADPSPRGDEQMGLCLDTQLCAMPCLHLPAPGPACAPCSTPTLFALTQVGEREVMDAWDAAILGGEVRACGGGLGCLRARKARGDLAALLTACLVPTAHGP